MKRKIFLTLSLSILIALLFSDNAVAGKNSRRVSNAEDFQKALDDGVTDITITQSFSGNFVIPRYIWTIKGVDPDITISPQDEKIPVFDAESSTKKNLIHAAEVLIWWPAAVGHYVVSEATSDNLTISNLTILCGTAPGISTNSISKEVNLNNITFKGVRSGRNNKSNGCYPSTITNFNGCTFEDLTWGVYAVDSSANYEIYLEKCNFKNVSQALAVNNSSKNAKAWFSKCSAEDLSYWVFQHGTGFDNVMYVDFDEETVSEYARSDFYHRVVENLDTGNSYDSEQLKNFIEDLQRCFKRLPDDVRKFVLSKKFSDWDEITLYSVNELRKKFRDFPSRENVNECLALYALLASAPIHELFDPNGDINQEFLKTACAEILSNSVRDEKLLFPLVEAFLDSTELAPLSRTGARISWGKTGNVRDALAKINQTPDRIFRDNIHKLQDWLTALEDVKNDLRDFQREYQRSTTDDYRAITELNQQVRGIYDLAIASNRLAC